MMHPVSLARDMPMKNYLNLETGLYTDLQCQRIIYYFLFLFFIFIRFETFGVILCFTMLFRFIV